MTIQGTVLAEGPGWHVQDVVCGAGPEDRPFEEVHATVAIALVTQGTFQYRSAQGAALMTPGSIMLGNVGACFECGHEHAVGDRCISFHYQPAFWEALVASVPGVRRPAFPAVRLSPVPRQAPLTANIHLTRLGRGALEANALDIGAAVLQALSGERATFPSVKPHEERRVTEAVRLICDSADEIESETLTISALGSAVGMSPYHFLRTFRRVVGSTPHQYLIRQRVHRAATRLLTSTDSVSDIAVSVGFGDLSTFNRRFKGLFGLSPRHYRRNNGLADPNRLS